jgi:hypothetical protein
MTDIDQQFENDEQLRGKLQVELPQLLAQADQEMRSGRLGDARNALRLAREVDPDNLKITTSLYRVEEYEKLHDDIVRARANAVSKENSPLESLKVLHAGLDALRFAQVDLVGELPEKITELLSLGDGLSSGNPDVYNQARGLINDFRKAEGAPTWVMRSAEDLAENWLRLTRKIALEGVRDSVALSGDFLGSYKAARKLVEADPFSEQAFKGVAKSHERLIVHQVQSAEKRYQWAKAAFAEDDFDNALENLDEIEARFFVPVEKEFKSLFENVEGVERIREKAQDLRRQIEKGREAYQTSLPIIEQARALFQSGKLSEAEAKLNELSQHVDFEPNSKALKKVEDFRNVIMEARIETATRVMEDGLAEIESGLNVALVNDFEGLRKDLDALKKQVDFKILPPAVSKKYGDTRARVEAALEKVGVSSVYRQKGEEALAQGDYVQSISHLQKARENAPDNISKANIDVLLNKAEKQVEEQKSQREAWDGAHTALEKSVYALARLHFVSVSAPEWQTGVEQGLEIAAIGLLYQQAGKFFEMDNLDEAQDVLSEAQARVSAAQKLSATDEYTARRQIIAEDLQKDIARLAQKLEWVKNNKIQERERLENEKAREEASQKALREKIVQAEDLLERNEFQPAKNIASEILADDPNHIDAREIWELALAQQQYDNKQIDDAIQTLENINLDQIVSVKIRNLVNKLDKQILADVGLGQKLKEARSAYEEGDLPSAERNAREVLDANPENVDARVIQDLVFARRQYDDGWVDFALKTLQRIPSNVTTDVWVRDLINQVRSHEDLKELRDFISDARLRFGEISSENIIRRMSKAESLRQQYSENQQISELIADMQTLLSQAQEFESFIQSAKARMSVANYIDALQFLDSAKKSLPASTKVIETLYRIALTNLAKQGKYYELLERGRKLMDAEDYEAAMATFQEAGELILTRGTSAVALPNPISQKSLDDKASLPGREIDDEPREKTSFTWNAPLPVAYDDEENNKYE